MTLKKSNPNEIDAFIQLHRGSFIRKITVNYKKFKFKKLISHTERPQFLTNFEKFKDLSPESYNELMEVYGDAIPIEKLPELLPHIQADEFSIDTLDHWYHTDVLCSLPVLDQGELALAVPESDDPKYKILNKVAESAIKDVLAAYERGEIVYAPKDALKNSFSFLSKKDAILLLQQMNKFLINFDVQPFFAGERSDRALRGYAYSSDSFSIHHAAQLTVDKREIIIFGVTEYLFLFNTWRKSANRSCE